MKRPDADQRLRHMLDHAREARDLTSDVSLEELEQSRQLNLAVVRLLEIVGEAAGRVPSEVQAELPEIPWPQIIGLRHRLIHGYFAIDLEIVWQILREDLPPLIDILEARLAPP